VCTSLFLLELSKEGEGPNPNPNSNRLGEGGYCGGALPAQSTVPPEMLMSIYKSLHDPDAIYGVNTRFGLGLGLKLGLELGLGLGLKSCKIIIMLSFSIILNTIIITINPNPNPKPNPNPNPPSTNLSLQALTYAYTGCWQEALATYESMMHSGSQGWGQGRGLAPKDGILEALRGLGSYHVLSSYKQHNCRANPFMESIEYDDIDNKDNNHDDSNDRNNDKYKIKNYNDGYSNNNGNNDDNDSDYMSDRTAAFMAFKVQTATKSLGNWDDVTPMRNPRGIHYQEGQLEQLGEGFLGKGSVGKGSFGEFSIGEGSLGKGSFGGYLDMSVSRAIKGVGGGFGAYSMRLIECGNLVLLRLGLGLGC
jgi:hypothetical protein